VSVSAQAGATRAIVSPPARRLSQRDQTRLVDWLAGAGPIQPNFTGGDSDAFIVQFAPDGTRGFGTYLGGICLQYGYDVAVDGDRSIYVAGITSSTNFPTVSPIQPVYAGGDFDAFAARLFPNGSSVAYSTFLGGNLNDQARAIDLRGNTDAYVAGTTESTNFPLASPYQAGQAGVNDIFISRITDITPPHEQFQSITYTYDPLRAALRAERGAIA